MRMKLTLNDNFIGEVGLDRSGLYYDFQAGYLLGKLMPWWLPNVRGVDLLPYLYRLSLMSIPTEYGVLRCSMES